MYLKGSLQQFCPQHYAEFHQQSFGHQQQSNMMYQAQGFPQGPQQGLSDNMSMHFGTSNSELLGSQFSGIV